MASIADLRKRIDKERPDCPGCRQPMYDMGPDGYVGIGDGGTRMIYACSECKTSIGTPVQINRVFYLNDDRPSRNEFLPGQDTSTSPNPTSDHQGDWRDKPAPNCPECDYPMTEHEWLGRVNQYECRICRHKEDRADDPRNNRNGGPMTSTTASTGSATGEVHDVETCDAQLDALDDDLQRVSASVEAIDEAISDAGAAAERIKAWLESKNVEDAAVSGMATVMEMLNPERIKELFDAVDNARRGVQATKESLTPLREAAGMLNGADGSVLNGR